MLEDNIGLAVFGGTSGLIVESTSNYDLVLEQISKDNSKEVRYQITKSKAPTQQTCRNQLSYSQMVQRFQYVEIGV